MAAHTKSGGLFFLDLGEFRNRVRSVALSEDHRQLLTDHLILQYKLTSQTRHASEISGHVLNQCWNRSAAGAGMHELCGETGCKSEESLMLFSSVQALLCMGGWKTGRLNPQLNYLLSPCSLTDECNFEELLINMTVLSP